MNVLHRADGSAYCPAVGHADFDCPGYPSEEHTALIKAGFGISAVPGPTDAELAREVRTDHDLVADEFHGRAP